MKRTAYKDVQFTIYTGPWSRWEFFAKLASRVAKKPIRRIFHIAVVCRLLEGSDWGGCEIGWCFSSLLSDSFFVFQFRSFPLLFFRRWCIVWKEGVEDCYEMFLDCFLKMTNKSSNWIQHFSYSALVFFCWFLFRRVLFLSQHLSSLLLHVPYA